MTDDNDSDDYFHDSRDGSNDNDSDDNDGRSTLYSDDDNSSLLSPSSEHLVSHYTMLVVGIDMWCLWTPGRGPFCV